MIGVVAVKRMSHFVSQREHIVQIFLIIQQYIRMRPISSPGIRASPFPFVFIDINPAVGKSLLQKLHIIVSQNGQTFLHDLLCLRKGNILAGGFGQRNIDIIHVQFLHLQRPLPETHIAVHQVQMVMNRLDQLGVYAGGDIPSVQRHFQTGRIFPHSGRKNVSCQISSIYCCQRILKFPVSSQKHPEGLFSHLPVLIFQESYVISLGQYLLVSVHSQLAELQIRILKHGKYVFRRPGHFSRHGKDTLQFL